MFLIDSNHQLLLHNQLALKINYMEDASNIQPCPIDLMVYLPIDGILYLPRKKAAWTKWTKKWLSRLSEDEIPEFLTETEQNKYMYKYKQNIMLHDCYKYLFLRSICQGKQYSVYILKLCRDKKDYEEVSLIRI